MKEVEGRKIIETLESNPKALEMVVMWIMANDHDKTYRKCKGCRKTSLASQFHGRRCNACSREYHRTHYSKKHPEIRRARKNAAKDSDDESSDDSSDESSDESGDDGDESSGEARLVKHIMDRQKKKILVEESSDESSDESYKSCESSESECEKSKNWKRRSVRNRD